MAISLKQAQRHPHYSKIEYLCAAGVLSKSTASYLYESPKAPFNCVEAAKAWSNISHLGDFDWTPWGHDPKSTQAIPGSKEKFDILCRRLELGLELHHPDDLSHVIDAKSVFVAVKEEREYRFGKKVTDV